MMDILVCISIFILLMIIAVIGSVAIVIIGGVLIGHPMDMLHDHYPGLAMIIAFAAMGAVAMWFRGTWIRGGMKL